MLSHATLFPETASRLSSLQTLEIPSAEQSAKLVELTPQVEECAMKQMEMEKDVEELRERSARCLEWWVQTGVVGIGELWEDWEARVGEIQRAVARFDRRRKEEEGYV